MTPQSTMNQLVRLCLVGAVSLLLVGCAAPGSSITRHCIRGTVVDSLGRGVPGQRVVIVLPASYGLGGLDTYFGRPEDYGHHDQRAMLTTDGSGNFCHLFDPCAYHITFFLLPPLGPFPRRPPKPVYGVHLSPCTYVVGYDRDHFDYRIIPASGPPERDPSQRVSGSYALREFQMRPDSPKKLKGWETSLTIRQ